MSSFLNDKVIFSYTYTTIMKKVTNLRKIKYFKDIRKVKKVTTSFSYKFN